MLKFSVVTVAFNSENTIARTIKSVLDQNDCSIEYIIVDGNSTDNTLDIISEFSSDRVPIKLISEPDKGVYDAYNKGLSMASGDVIVFLNSDDFFAYDNVLSKVCARMIASDVDVFCAGTELINSDMRVARTSLPKAIGRAPYFSQLPMPSLFIRLRVFQDLGISFDKQHKISSDLKLQLEIHKANMHTFEIGKFVTTKQQLGGISTNSLSSYLSGWIEVVKVYDDVFKTGGLKYLIFKVIQKLI